jgi:hypothetical protein
MRKDITSKLHEAARLALVGRATFLKSDPKALQKGTSSGRSSVGRASASQAEGRGFEPHRPLQVLKPKPV